MTRRNDGNMPKLKTHKGIKKRFKVTATGKVKHKRCGSSHLMSHKSGSQIRKLRKKSVLAVSAEAKKLRRAIHKRESFQPQAIEAARLVALADAGETPAAHEAKLAADGFKSNFDRNRAAGRAARKAAKASPDTLVASGAGN